MDPVPIAASSETKSTSWNKQLYRALQPVVKHNKFIVKKLDRDLYRSVPIYKRYLPQEKYLAQEKMWYNQFSRTTVMSEPLLTKPETLTLQSGMLEAGKDTFVPGSYVTWVYSKHH